MKVLSAKYEGDYRLLIEFNDGLIVDADFHDFIFNSRQPMTNQFKDKSLFALVNVNYGILDWFGEMDFDPADIYFNRIPGVEIHEIHAA